MRQPRYPVFVITGQRRVRVGFSAPANEESAQIALKLRDKGWDAYRLRFEAETDAWIASVIDWKRKHAVPKHVARKHAA